MEALLLSFLLCFLLCRPATVEADEPSLRRLKGLAEQYERDGRAAEAAKVYEQLLDREPASRNIYLSRLVDLYVLSAQPARALERARLYMEYTPDPEAYLAQVYAALGGYREAEALLDNALAADTDAVRRQRLILQKADLLERQEKADDAEALREKARSLRP